MKTLGQASLFMPQTFLLPLLALAGLFMMFGLRKIAGTLFVTGLVTAFSPMLEPMFDAIFSAMPPWFLLVSIARQLLLLAGRFMRDLLVHVLGELIANSIKVIVSSQWEWCRR